MEVIGPKVIGADARIRNVADLLNVLDKLLENRDDAWWDEFFADRARSVPFFVDWPDETLVSDFTNHALRPGRVLELGCGNGRNAIYMASVNCSVDAVDFSEAAIRWGMERAQAAKQQVHFIHGSIFELKIQPAAYDIIYDSGCFHHVLPHRREAYLKLVSTALKPEGILSLICFSPDGGSGLSDLQVYEQRTLGGGLGFSEESLRQIFGSCFELVDIRRMNEMLPTDRLYGKDFLSAVRMLKR
ncbi:MAG: class I SAM-dependent methyltransferase [Candidatus Velthaea sp.]